LVESGNPEVLIRKIRVTNNAWYNSIGAVGAFFTVTNFYVTHPLMIRMIVTFSVSEVKELFTTYDYKQLIKAVEKHFNENAEYQGVHVTTTAYYNPEQNEGILLAPNVNEYVYVSDLQIAYGSDFITVKFKYQ